MLKKPSRHAVGTQQRRQRGGQRLRRRTIEIIEHVPAEDAVDRARRFLEALREEFRQLIELVVLDVPIDVLGDVFDAQAAAELLAEERDVAADDGTEIEQQRTFVGLQAGEKLVQRLGRIRRLGHVRDRRIGRGAASATRRGPNIPKRSVNERVASAMCSAGYAPTGWPCCCGCGCGSAAAAGLLRRGRLGLLLRLLRLLSRALHVDAAAEVRAFGNGDARRGDVAVDRAVVANVDLFRRRDVARHFAQDDDRLREDFGLDLAVRPDGQDVVLEIDPAFDVAFDREVFAAAQLALDDD